jgi:hypothetical protein
MPLMYGSDTEGCYVKWGSSGKKYHYQCGSQEAKKGAESKANEQAKAIRVSQSSN